MSASMGPSEGGQDFELNLASIIDCFTVLIAFMLASASFLSIGILDAGVAAAGATSSGNTPPTVQVTVEIKEGHVLNVNVSGKAQAKHALQPLNGAWDIEALGRQLKSIKAQWPDLNGATLIADNAIEYREVVKLMDTTRKILPAVMLGGF